MVIRHNQISSFTAPNKYLTAAILSCSLALFGGTAALAQSSSGSSGSSGSTSMSPGSPSAMPPAPSGGSDSTGGAAPATGATGATSPPAARQPPSDKEIATQFNAADANGDGKLSKEEAKTGMPGLYRNFDRIDTKGAGFVTQDDLTVALKR